MQMWIWRHLFCELVKTSWPEVLEILEILELFPNFFCSWNALEMIMHLVITNVETKICNANVVVATCDVVLDNLIYILEMFLNCYGIFLKKQLLANLQVLKRHKVFIKLSRFSKFSSKVISFMFILYFISLWFILIWY